MPDLNNNEDEINTLESANSQQAGLDEKPSNPGVGIQEEEKFSNNQTSTSSSVAMAHSNCDEQQGKAKLSFQRPGRRLWRASPKARSENTRIKPQGNRRAVMRSLANIKDPVDLTMCADDEPVNKGVSPCYQISNEDLRTCEPGQWLNDNIIYAYLSLLKDYANLTGRVTCHVLDSFFFTLNLEQGYSGVSQKGSQIPLDVDIILMPICTRQHWTLVVLHPRTRVIQRYDSLHGLGDNHVHQIQKWLDTEYKSGAGPEWTIGDHVSPRQDNSDDCGVFVLATARSVIMRTALDYNTDVIAMMRKKIVEELKENLHSAKVQLELFEFESLYEK
ncbi:cysteine proteinase [Aspergillus saccharolyticus JOP 1030-1]|uniref:Cysteine proteinase n=1 Tax=Aspergillus saccharolyticus JOP 1030-1 TaxID=1450539 RepID=A0A318ZL85_9EURO|nr:cysteine proteinase [Aspergillus saccharolyticus JOP 1030-1]PYH40998.1 cysteine proteinase [Aspergillus saccharolyticus JOP 1030-1]